MVNVTEHCGDLPAEFADYMSLVHNSSDED